MGLPTGLPAASDPARPRTPVPGLDARFQSGAFASGLLWVIACVEDRPLIAGTEPLKSPLLAYSVEKLAVEVGDSAALSSKRGLHSG
jgi:hypothetical protein